MQRTPSGAQRRILPENHQRFFAALGMAIAQVVLAQTRGHGSRTKMAPAIAQMARKVTTRTGWIASSGMTGSVGQTRRETSATAGAAGFSSADAPCWLQNRELPCHDADKRAQAPARKSLSVHRSLPDWHGRQTPARPRTRTFGQIPAKNLPGTRLPAVGSGGSGCPLRRAGLEDLHF
jgi:hypothetical protein